MLKVLLKGYKIKFYDVQFEEVMNSQNFEIQNLTILGIPLRVILGNRWDSIPMMNYIKYYNCSVNPLKEFGLWCVL
jgi:hypothetical protein